MKTLTATEAREGFADALADAAYRHERVLVTKQGKPVAALISYEDLQLLEALEEQADIAAADRALAEQGDEPPVTHEELKRKYGL